MAGHLVRIPHPDRQEPTVGSCGCGWTVLYGAGQQKLAVDAALGHISEMTGGTPPKATYTPREDRA